MKIPFPAFALLGTPHAGKPPRVVRVRVVEVYALLDCALVHDVDTDGYNTGRARTLPLAQVASLKTLAGKTALFSAPDSRPPLASSGPGQHPTGMTDSGAENLSLKPQPALAFA